MWPLRRQSSRTREAEDALLNAQAHLETIQKRAGEVNEVAASLRRMRERNHFAEHLTRILEGGDSR